MEKSEFHLKLASVVLAPLFFVLVFSGCRTGGPLEVTGMVLRRSREHVVEKREDLREGMEIEKGSLWEMFWGWDDESPSEPEMTP